MVKNAVTVEQAIECLKAARDNEERVIVLMSCTVVVIREFGQGGRVSPSEAA